jgi:predicted enzyme related to lactoylglutathione lyase
MFVIIRRGRHVGFDHERRGRMGQPVVHWEIAAKDARKAQEFYSKLFDWTINIQQPMNYAYVQTGGQGGINGGIYEAKEGMPPSVTF